MKPIFSTGIAIMDLSYRTAPSLLLFSLLLSLLLSLHFVVSFVLVIVVYINFNSSIRKSYKQPGEEAFKPQRFLNAQTLITGLSMLPNKQPRESFKAS
jgi:uncharacterized membrane protein